MTALNETALALHADLAAATGAIPGSEIAPLFPRD
jgi:hypothetical protein